LVLVLGIALCGQVAPAADEKSKPLPPAEVTLRTNRDGLPLVCTYYPSKLGKEAVPIILLHAAQGRRSDFNALALELQLAGHAVIAPDLRGHGEGAIPHAEPRQVDILAMGAEGGDVEAVKTFLLKENDKGALNIERLCVVGVEMGATVAVQWAALDWSWPTLNTGKQGQDVKGLVLISPEWGYKGVRINDAVADPNIRTLPMLIVTGRRNNRLFQEAKRLHTALEKHHLPPPEDAPEKQTLWLKTPATSLQGMALMNERSMNVHAMIVAFVDYRMVKPAFAWRERRRP
jgi:pimeloyl-ACP methyl ester carboxylesterase